MIYLYALCETDYFPFPELQGLDDHIVQAMPCGDVTFAASDVMASPTCDLASICRHEAVIESLSARRPTLPFRFGTVVPDLAAIDLAVRKRLTAVLANLDRVTGCVELGLTVMPAPEEEGEPDSDAAKEAVGSGQEYLNGLRRRETLRLTRREDLKAKVGGLNAELQKLSRSSRPLSSEQPGDALRFAYLVPWNAISTFKAKVSAAQKKADMPALLASGPWPPYSFVKSDLLALAERDASR